MLQEKRTRQSKSFSSASALPPRAAKYTSCCGWLGLSTMPIPDFLPCTQTPIFGLAQALYWEHSNSFTKLVDMVFSLVFPKNRAIFAKFRAGARSHAERASPAQMRVPFLQSPPGGLGGAGSCLFGSHRFSAGRAANVKHVLRLFGQAADH